MNQEEEKEDKLVNILFDGAINNKIDIEKNYENFKLKIEKIMTYLLISINICIGFLFSENIGNFFVPIMVFVVINMIILIYTIFKLYQPYKNFSTYPIADDETINYLKDGYYNNLELKKFKVNFIEQHYKNSNHLYEQLDKKQKLLNVVLCCCTCNFLTIPIIYFIVSYYKLKIISYYYLDLFF